MSSDMKTAIVENIITMRPAILITVLITLIAYGILMICIRRLRVQGRGNRLARLFVGLGGRSLLHLGLSWVKFAFTVSCLLLIQPAELPQYLFLAVMTVCTLLCGFSLSGILTELAGGGLLLAGMAACSTLLKYLRQIRFETSIFIAYWLLAIFLILCAAAIFFREVTAVSQERKYFDENGETE